MCQTGGAILPLSAKLLCRLLQTGDRVTLRRFVAAMLNADIDRGDRLQVAFTVTLPDLIGKGANYLDEGD